MSRKPMPRSWPALAARRSGSPARGRMAMRRSSRAKSRVKAARPSCNGMSPIAAGILSSPTCRSTAPACGSASATSLPASCSEMAAVPTRFCLSCGSKPPIPARRSARAPCPLAGRSAAAYRRGSSNEPRSQESLSRVRGRGFSFCLPLIPRQGLVANTMRPLGLGAEAPAAVCPVIGVIAFEPHDLTVAFKGEDVGRDAIEKPTVMRDDDGAAGIIEQRLCERAQRVDIEIVGRLVEQEKVGALLQHLCEMHPVALAAGELTDLFLLVGAAEIEQRAIGAARDLAAAEIDLVLPARDLLPDGTVGAERIA